MFRFDGKIVVVTGAARGMGKQVSKSVGKLGATVCMLDKLDLVTESARELVEDGIKAFGYYCDVTDKENVKEVFGHIAKEHGTIDKLANVAGISKSLDFLSDDSDFTKELIMDVNFNGVWNTCREVIPYMIANGSGSIVNFSSITGNLVSDPGMAAYSASKAAVAGLTRSLAVEFADRNISVNSILPGYVWTDMLAKYVVDKEEEVKERFSKGIPMKRLGTTEEAGSIVAFMLSDEASYITGHGLVFDGGTSLVETKEIVVKDKKR